MTTMNWLSFERICATVLLVGLISAECACPITDDIRIVYSLVDGVGPASKIWVEDFLWWWQTYDPSVRYLGMSAEDMQECDFASFPNLKVYINPGGNAYDQLTALGVKGTTNIKNFVLRDQTVSTSAYVGFCAGGYIASHDYLWETIYEGPGYYNYADNPPLSLFPHTVEGSIVDINDDQYADQNGSKFRAVNVSNGHTMLYYGGSTFGWNGASAYADKTSANFDPNLEVLIYYTDFYGYNSVNIPAAWRYAPTGERKNLLLTSVHPEADNCTNAQDSDCPPPESLHTVDILRNRAWLCEYTNQAAGTTFAIPPVPVAPSFNTSAPHISYPTYPCYTDVSGGVCLFCDTFDSNSGQVPQGLSPQFQRNQTNYNRIFPWNSTFISEWGGVQYATPYSGDGYAVNVPGTEAIWATASITSKPFPLSTWTSACIAINVSYAYTGHSNSGGVLLVEYLRALSGIEEDEGWEELSKHSLTTVDHAVLWDTNFVKLSRSEELLGASHSRLRFTCSAGAVVGSFCGLDSLKVSCLL